MRPALRPMGPPLDPSEQEARRWAEEELAKSVYDQGPGVLDRILEWLAERWEALLNLGGAGAVLMPVLVLVLVAAVVAVAMVLGGPVRRRQLRRVTGPSTQVLDDDERSADALRTAAAAASERGDYALAVLERFRAVVRGLDERDILTDRLGRTAHEAAEQAGAAFGDQAGALRAAGELFDAVRYGSAVPGSEQDAWLRDLDERIARTRPERFSGAGPDRGWSVVR
ncbi:DUF4129 domain-containing protein [Pseudactinotalea sp. Z1739]|uniref:DUF4129 domain-containing protein n=1 Tax=Pseudactinotalea sp. Z1739 TaxID=3413028 RepID=UPI003C7C1CC6